MNRTINTHTKKHLQHFWKQSNKKLKLPYLITPSLHAFETTCNPIEQKYLKQFSELFSEWVLTIQNNGNKNTSFQFIDKLSPCLDHIISLSCKDNIYKWTKIAKLHNLLCLIIVIIKDHYKRLLKGKQNENDGISSYYCLICIKLIRKFTEIVIVYLVC